MSAPAEDFYSEDRWQNWIDRITDEELDPGDEDSARLLLNLQDDVSIAVAKILQAFENDLAAADSMEELETIRDIVLDDPGIADEETAMLVDGVQTSLVCVFYAAQRYIAEGVADEAAIEGYLRSAADAEADDDYDRALDLAAAAGTRVIDGEELDIGVTEDFEYGLVTEWVNGLDSLQSALSVPEVIEE